jgi:hypothetical protein
MNARAIAEILAPVFAEQNWTWFTGTPDVDELEAQIEDLVDRLKDDPELTNIGTGRLIAYRIDPKHDPDWIHVALDFVYDC